MNTSHRPALPGPVLVVAYVLALAAAGYAVHWISTSGLFSHGFTRKQVLPNVPDLISAAISPDGSRILILTGIGMDGTAVRYAIDVLRRKIGFTAESLTHTDPLTDPSSAARRGPLRDWLLQ